MRNKNTLIVGAAIVAVLFLGFIISRGQKHQAPQTPGSAQDLYNQATLLSKNNEILKAKELYQKIITDHPDYEGVEGAEKDLENLNLKIIFSNVQTPQVVVHEVQVGDSLGKIAKKYNTTVELIKRRNNLNSDTIRAGQKLSIWNGNFNIFVDKSQNILILKDGDQ